MLAEAQRAVRDETTPSGELRVGSLEDDGGTSFAAYSDDLHAPLPDVDLQIETGPTEAMIDGVLERRLDGAFVSGRSRIRISSWCRWLKKNWCW
ncbi:MAG: LysR substrate-binding domain-containing protein [Aliidongia sp.]